MDNPKKKDKNRLERMTSWDLSMGVRNREIVFIGVFNIKGTTNPMFFN